MCLLRGKSIALLSVSEECASAIFMVEQYAQLLAPPPSHIVPSVLHSSVTLFQCFIYVF